MEELKKKLINRGLFHHEMFPEEILEMEESLGITKKELQEMDFLEILEFFHDKYFLVTEFRYKKNDISVGDSFLYNDVE